jgi:hypothetical protein
LSVWVYLSPCSNLVSSSSKLSAELKLTLDPSLSPPQTPHAGLNFHHSQPQRVFPAPLPKPNSFPCTAADVAAETSKFLSPATRDIWRQHRDPFFFPFASARLDFLQRISTPLRPGGGRSFNAAKTSNERLRLNSAPLCKLRTQLRPFLEIGGWVIRRYKRKILRVRGVPPSGARSENQASNDSCKLYTFVKSSQDILVQKSGMAYAEGEVPSFDSRMSSR